MNISIYIFGEFHSGYTQYPYDYSEGFLKSFAKNAKATTQVTIHRDGDLMHYGYIRKLENEEYLGLCAIVNGVYLTKLDGLFGIFEQVVEFMVRNGYLIHFNDNGELVSDVTKLHESGEEMDIISAKLKTLFENLESTSQKLPPTNYGVAKDSIENYSIQDDEQAIVKSSYTNGYTYIYKSKGFNTAQMNSYKGIIARKEREIQDLQNKHTMLRTEISTLKNKQRNTTWVSALAIVALVLFGIVYTKVINPSEVTKKDMGEYVYYGPIANGEPNGVGVAIYHANDRDGRLYYYGSFKDGKRIDENAIMFYKDGSYFRGTMNEDKWIHGLFFDVEQAQFIGEFRDNEPWNGHWYKRVKEQTLVNGKPQ
jgi:hypothetical protein